MVGVMCIPESNPGDVLSGLSPSLASFMQQLPPSNGNAPDLDMLISILLQNAIPSVNFDSTSTIPLASSAFPSSRPGIDNISSSKQGTSLLNVSNLRSSNAGHGLVSKTTKPRQLWSKFNKLFCGSIYQGGHLMKSSHALSNVTDSTSKLHKGNEAHTINTSSSLRTFIHKLPIVNGPSPNVDKVISALFHADIPRNDGFHMTPSTSRRPNSSTMKSSQTSHQLKRKRNDDDKEEVVQEKPAMDIFKLRQIRKLRAMAANQNGTTSQTSSRSSSARS